MKKPIFTAGLRTPFGRAFKGPYQDIRADDLLVEILIVLHVAHPDDRLVQRGLVLLRGHRQQCRRPDAFDQLEYQKTRSIGLFETVDTSDVQVLK